MTLLARNRGVVGRMASRRLGEIKDLPNQPRQLRTMALRFNRLEEAYAQAARILQSVLRLRHQAVEGNDLRKLRESYETLRSLVELLTPHLSLDEAMDLRKWVQAVEQDDHKTITLDQPRLASGRTSTLDDVEPDPVELYRFVSRFKKQGARLSDAAAALESEVRLRGQVGGKSYAEGMSSLLQGYKRLEALADELEADVSSLGNSLKVAVGRLRQIDREAINRRPVD